MPVTLEELGTQGLGGVFLGRASMGDTASVIIVGEGATAAVVSLPGPRCFQRLRAGQEAPAVAAPKLFIAGERNVAAR